MAERPEGLNLPNMDITRIIKKALPDSINISKECHLPVSSSFVLYLLFLNLPLVS
uniref:Transcription factor CBF/NF-Y/archaeal histone domain-containing protein n=1 Tax=Monodelphis domestica TaxID=13616 RepID=A0A5F8HDL7_MONDO